MFSSSYKQLAANIYVVFKFLLITGFEPLVLEVTALPSEPQPLHKYKYFLNSTMKVDSVGQIPANLIEENDCFFYFLPTWTQFVRVQTIWLRMGRVGGGQVVTFYSDNPSSNPAEG